MSAVDVWLLLLLAAAAVIGYRRGFVVGILAFVGLVVGAALGMMVSLRVVQSWVPGPQQTLVALFVLIFIVSIIQGIMSIVGTRLRSKLTWRPGRVADAACGSAISALTVLALAWALSITLSQTQIPGVTNVVRESALLKTVDRLMPSGGEQLLGSFRELIDDSSFPKVFSGLDDEQISPVDAPDARLLKLSEIAKASASVVEITGDANSCKQRVTGSGYVYSAERVLTNAHVVSGVSSPVVRIDGKGKMYDATVVAFDPRRDLAVLAVPGLPAAPVEMSSASLRRGDDVVVAGFPNGGPYTVSAGRVREVRQITGPDIYERDTVTRDVLSLRAAVEHGSSGGPVFTTDGKVAGLIFAKSTSDDETAYALQLSEIIPIARQGQSATAPVPTGTCAG